MVCERAESATMADCCWMMRMFSGVTAAARGIRRRVSMMICEVRTVRTHWGDWSAGGQSDHLYQALLRGYFYPDSQIVGL